MIALVTCAAARSLDTDLPLLTAELAEAEVVEWNDPTVDWPSFRCVVLRSAWDYHHDRPRFLAWSRSVAASTALWNPLDVIEWNTDKRYLAELAALGLPVVETEFVAEQADVDRLASRDGFAGDVVVKPTVGASASGVVAIRDDPAAAVAHAHTLIERGLTAMVQPYMHAIEEHGETGLVYLGGRYSHAFARRVVLRDGGFDGDAFGDEESAARAATSDEIAVGDAVMATLPPTAYARIDMLPGPTGPRILEVELTEPSLFLHLDDGAPERAAAVFRNL